jgi:hypothetical protein
MKTVIKLTDQDRKTHGGFQWRLGETFTAAGPGEEPCSNGVIHWYDCIEVALLANPIHAAVANPRAWEMEINNELGHDGLKGWSKSGKLVREVALPTVTLEQRVEFGIRCALLVPQPDSFKAWAVAAAVAAEAVAVPAGAAAGAVREQIREVAQRVINGGRA